MTGLKKFKITRIIEEIYTHIEKNNGENSLPYHNYKWKYLTKR